MRHVIIIFLILGEFVVTGCQQGKQTDSQQVEMAPEPDYSLSADQTHNRWSSTVEPALRVESGSIIEVYTKEASDRQLHAESTLEDLTNLDFDPIHPLTGPVYVEGAEPGDILKVKLHKIELGEWGWTAIIPGFGFLADDFDEPWLKTYKFAKESNTVQFDEGIHIPLNPFPGVMGVAPATDSLLSTIPPRYNGGNMDDPHMIEGTTVYFPVFVEGALFSIGDAHAAQGMGEVCGTAIEAPMRIVYEVEIIKHGRTIPEPEYESDNYYAVTAFGTTIDEASKKATRYMINYLETVHGMGRYEAYALLSLAGDLKIAEVVDVPHMLVAMHIPKSVIGLQ